MNLEILIDDRSTVCSREVCNAYISSQRMKTWIDISTRCIYDRYVPCCPFKDEVREITRSVIKTYRSEYIRNRHIPAINKIVFFIYYHLPSIYSLDRWIICVKAKMKHI